MNTTPPQVLIAHSDAAFSEDCCDRLRRAGIIAERADSGIDCMEHLRSARPNVLILNLDLPWGGGDGVLAQMVADPILRTVHVVLLLGSRSEGPRIPAAGRDIVRMSVDMPNSPNRLIRLATQLLDCCEFARQSRDGTAQND